MSNNISSKVLIYKESLGAEFKVYPVKKLSFDVYPNGLTEMFILKTL